MGRLRQKGKAGAAKAYITRSAAVKKLQCSLADFRRLCILKGIFPREPRHRKKANKGSSAPASFYYAKDIAYLAHEPVLKKLREHKTFTKKLARALGRGEWSHAKSLEENKPIYRLDHIIKERYPTFIDAIRDIDDALCMIFLFSTLPSDVRLSTQLIENCSRLSAEWQLYVMHSHSLRKAFFSIKGVYYQAEILDQTITWLVPYQFPQNVPADVDIRVMLTFLEFYQTLLGFALFKLYTDAGLVYPPARNLKKDESGAGIGAFIVQDANQWANDFPRAPSSVEIDGRKITGREVRQTIKKIGSVCPPDEPTETSETMKDREEEFITYPSASGPQLSNLPTLQSLANGTQSMPVNLFAHCVFFLSRETSRPTFEFLVRSFGGRIGWHSSSGSGSPFEEGDEAITHVIIDRPLVELSNESPEERERRMRRKYIQPQWVVDCINAGRILLEEPYAQGKILPPHLSPFGEEYEGAYHPTSITEADNKDVTSGGREASSEDDDNKVALEKGKNSSDDLEEAIEKSDEDPSALRGAELAAEAAGMDYATFEGVLRSRKLSGNAKPAMVEDQDPEGDMNKMMMSNKQRKLYEKIKHSQRKREKERTNLMAKKHKIQLERQRTDKVRRDD